ncbi:hypothetical protein [Streptomyces sp. IBSBF 3010]|uniref:hypothetical protein n=1 Tax=Streptomyces sp. IBSBF 3010 TaxID=2903526 RepID=UPI002FDC224B
MRNRASRTADRRRSFTGESHQLAYSGLRLGQPPIPSASAFEQQNFEADVFGAILTSHNRFTEFPLGIRSVRPRPASLEVEVESESRGKNLLIALLPDYEVDTGEVSGTPGLRIRQITERGLELHLDGRRTSLWLTGMPRSAWRRIVKDRAAEDFPGWRQLWTETKDWTAEELAYDAQWNTGQWSKGFYDGAWCASALLRRIAVLRTIAPVYAVSGWQGLGTDPVRWCMEIDFRPGTPQYRDQLVAALTDPEFGLFVAPALDASEGPLPAHVMQFADAGRTALIEFRFSSGMFRSYGKEHPDLHARIESRIERILARHGTWRA